MITYDFSQRNGLPKYEYLFQCIREDIRAGALKPGTRLPSKKMLAKHLSISVSTVEGAYDLLVSGGYAESRPGSGFYISKRAGDYVTSNGVPQREPLAPPQAASPKPADQPTSPQSESALPSIDMHANSCSLGLFPTDVWARIMRRVLSDKNPELFETVPFNGLPKLRRAIAQNLYEFKGMQVDPDCIVIGAGTEYLYTKVLQLLGASTVIGIGDIGFKKLTDIFMASGTLWAHVPVDSQGIDVDALAASAANVAHVSPANHFPIGAVMSAERRTQLLSWLAERGYRYIVEDDYDSELRFSGRALPPLFTQDPTGRVIYLNTFSKTLVPSLRISYMVLPDALMDIYRQQLSFYSCTVSSFEQSALAEFIERGYLERHINRLRRFYDKQRERITEAIRTSGLAKIAHLREVNVGTHMLVHIDTRLSDTQVKAAARRAGMRLNVLADYCILPTADTAHTLVINFASVAPEQIGTAMHILEGIFADDIARA